VHLQIPLYFHTGQADTTYAEDLRSLHLFRQLEEVLLVANTNAGKKWRKLVLKIKNLVVQYMKKGMAAKIV
jgi:hypothetical protein